MAPEAFFSLTTHLLADKLGFKATYVRAKLAQRRARPPKRAPAVEAG
jgi:hypothetical protein